MIELGIYKHYKGNYYVVEAVAALESNPEEHYAVYRDIQTDRVWVRVLSEFMKPVSKLHLYLEEARKERGIFAIDIDNLSAKPAGYYLNSIANREGYVDDQLRIFASALSVDIEVLKNLNEQGTIQRFVLIQKAPVNVAKFKKENLV